MLLRNSIIGSIFYNEIDTCQSTSKIEFNYFELIN